jgi:dipeptidyl aminopeptidase/acylaminoacyl peptidase
MVGGRFQVFIVGSSGGMPRRLTEGKGSSKIPSFSHDGKWVYFADDRTGRDEVFRIPFGGGAAMQVTHSGGTVPQESVDGQTIYYLTSSRMGPAALYATPVSGGHERALGIQVFGRAFQVVADGIYFMAPAGKDGRGPEIRFYDFASHQSRLIQALGDVSILSGLSVSPDRKIFLYTVREDSGRNLMLVDNFR